jgi:hypothetical protein
MDERNDADELQMVRFVELTVPSQTRLTQLAAIVKDHQAAEIDGMLVDATTASVMVKVALALSGANRAKFLGFPLKKMVDVGWKLID